MPVLTRNIQETKFTLYGSGGTTSQECVVGMLTHISACVHICMFACFTHLETLPLITRATTYCREWGMEAHKCRFEQQSPKRAMRWEKTLCADTKSTTCFLGRHLGLLPCWDGFWVSCLHGTYAQTYAQIASLKPEAAVNNTNTRVQKSKER